jgi:UrcA family protein
MKIQSKTRSTLCVLYAAAIGLLSVHSADAAPQRAPDGVAARSVSFADLNIDRPEGVAALYGRIRQAADSVCAVFQSRELKAMSASRECVHAAVSRAVSSVQLPALTAYANSKMGQTPGIVVASRGR